ncbi:MAG: flagellar basal body M-ring protein FliF [Candidatus Competibacteraceae bacterium]|nr:MAG: flagellar basal body M-ring protein FliF [Candidatus Competibacteraceae bacterium]
MAEATPGPAPNLPAPFDWRSWLAAFRHPGPSQIGIMAGGAALLALLITAALWYGAPRYDVLYRGLAEADAGQIMDALQKANIPFRVDSRSGALTVPAHRVHEARLNLAGQGLPRGTVSGLEALEQQTGFGVSQFMETARYQHALEGELARSIMTIGAVENARVHLAFPRETVFARQQQPPTASVLVRLHAGRILDEGQVAAIVHLIAASVPKLQPAQVSVIDQGGNLLTRSDRQGGAGSTSLSLDQLEYTRRLEDRYTRRVEDLLTPVLGMGRVRAQVTLDLDFTTSEETAERYEPRDEPRPVRSEQLLEETRDPLNPAGIPGALANQPPGAAAAPEVAVAPGLDDPPDPAAPPRLTRKEVTRNYELDKRVSHTRNTPGRILRVSTAVVVDDRFAVESGQPVRTPLTEAEIDRITALVQQAVGFSAERGDSINVMNATFAPSPFDEPILPMWQQSWFLELVKWAVVAVIALALLLVVRPLLRRLLPAPVAASHGKIGRNGQTAPALPAGEENGLEGLLEDQVQISGALENGRAKTPAELTAELENQMSLARLMVAEDPKRAVQVIKIWLSNEA